MSKAKRIYNRIKQEEEELQRRKEYISSLYSALTYKKYLEFYKEDIIKALDDFCNKYPQCTYEIYNNAKYVNTNLVSLNYEGELKDDIIKEWMKLEDSFNENIVLFTNNHELF